MLIEWDENKRRATTKLSHDGLDHLWPLLSPSDNSLSLDPSPLFTFYGVHQPTIIVLFGVSTMR